jgi:RNA polymerase sigma-70 factor (ECF subfamily)
MKPPSQSDLIEGVLRGEPGACRRLVEMHQGGLYRLALRMLRDEHLAQDVCQETFLRTLGRLRRLDARRPLVFYLRKVATNLCISELRRRRRVLPLEQAAEVPAPAAGPADGDRRLCEAVDAAVQGLPAHQRAAFVLFHQERMDYRAIAELTGRPINTVRSDLRRARRHVGDALRAAGLV